MIASKTVIQAYLLRRAAATITGAGDKDEAIKVLQDRYNLKVDPDSDTRCVFALNESLKRLPVALVKDCGIKPLKFENMGPSREYYPNHGRYMDGTLALNSTLLDDDRMIVDEKAGAAFNKFDQTLFHELGHGWDEAQCPKGHEQLSTMPEWLNLSGWSEKQKPGLHRIKIREQGTPEVVGEWWFDPNAGFTRFYGKRNPYDDWADCFSYYVGNLKGKLPQNKTEYFDRYLKKYYGGVSDA